jgi:hypothetical protein
LKPERQLVTKGKGEPKKSRSIQPKEPVQRRLSIMSD